MWEAFQHAGWEGLDNLVAIIDVNRLGQTRETMLGWDTAAYAERIRAFGWNAIEIDGHDVDEIEAAYAEAESTKGKPTAVIARTMKGKGVKAVEDQPGKHGKPLDGGRGDRGARRLPRAPTVEIVKPEAGEPGTFETSAGGATWELGEEVATRKAYGEALTALGAIDGYVVALDVVSNSTHSELPQRPRGPLLRDVHRGASCSPQPSGCRSATAGSRSPRRSRRSSREAYDFIRMAAISRADIKLAGSHAGVSIGEDGPSQMALEDIASMRAIPPRRSCTRPAPTERAS